MLPSVFYSEDKDKASTERADMREIKQMETKLI